MNEKSPGIDEEHRPSHWADGGSDSQPVVSQLFGLWGTSLNLYGLCFLM